MCTTTAALLTAALQEEEEAQAQEQQQGETRTRKRAATATAPRDVRVVGATSLFVPGLATPHSSGPIPFPSSGSRVAVEDAEGLARVFGFVGVKQQKDGVGVAAAAAAAAAAAPSVELLLDDGAVRPGETMFLWVR